LPDDRLTAAVARYLAIYAELPADPASLYPGVDDTLRRLVADGHALGLCTNKPEAISRALLDGLGLGGLFGAVVGGDTLPRRKPDPAPLLLALRHLGASPAQGAMIGDSANDIQAARAAGLPVVAVSYGYARMPVADLGADHVIDRFADLPAALDRLAAHPRAAPVP